MKPFKYRKHHAVWVGMLLWPLAATAGGPFSLGYGESGVSAMDEPIAGFTGPLGNGAAPYLGTGTSQHVNTAFKGWATRVVTYAPAHPELINTDWKVTSKVLGPVTGDAFDIVSLGDLSTADMSSGRAPGTITLEFSGGIADLPGPDFAVFENALDVEDYVFAELAYVEVSSDGVNFARFPSQYWNNAPGAEESHDYWFQDPTGIYNLAGKHENGYGNSWGTPFDLAELSSHPLVAGGQLNLAAVRYVRLVDIPGNGSRLDSLGHAIYDAWVTIGSPGFDLEAVGVLHPAAVNYANWATAITDSTKRGAADDPDRDGLPNLIAYALGGTPGQVMAVSGRPRPEADEWGNFSLVFPVDAKRPDVEVVVEKATVLNGNTVWTRIAHRVGTGNWTALNGGGGPLAYITVSGTSPNQTVKVMDATALIPRAPRFLRLRAILNSGS